MHELQTIAKRLGVSHLTLREYELYREHLREQMTILGWISGRILQSYPQMIQISNEEYTEFANTTLLAGRSPLGKLKAYLKAASYAKRSWMQIYAQFGLEKACELCSDVGIMSMQEIQEALSLEDLPSAREMVGREIYYQYRLAPVGSEAANTVIWSQV